jgi:hypothetical protein
MFFGRITRLCFLVDSTFLHGVKKIFHAAEDIKELIDPYVNFSFAGQQVLNISINLVFMT